MKLLRFPLIHPLLMSVYPVVALYSANLYQVLFSETYLPFFFSLASGLIIFISGLIFSRNLAKAALFTTVIHYLFFTFGHLEKIIPYPVLIFSVYGIIIFILVIRIRQPKNLNQITVITNLITMILVIIPLSAVLKYQLQPKDELILQNPLETRHTKQAISPLPDIYFIIFDRYASSSVLKQNFAFDNSNFINKLKEKNFYIAEKAWANYASSAHSLSATLNMTHLDFLKDLHKPDDKDWLPLYDLLENNRVVYELKNLGYQYYHFGDWWWPTSKSRLADQNINLNVLSEFSSILVDNSILKLAAQKYKLPILDYRFTQWRRIRYKFQKLKEMPKVSKPTFVFAHMLVPHEPFVFKADGSFLTIEEDSQRSNEEKYLDQIKYINGEIISLTEKLLENRENPPVIIFQADEGPYPVSYENNKNDYDWSKAKREEISQKMSIFSAIYLPDKDYSLLSEDFSPVNNFRLVLSILRGEEPDYLPDRYQLTNMGKPYDFYEYARK